MVATDQLQEAKGPTPPCQSCPRARTEPSVPGQLERMERDPTNPSRSPLTAPGVGEVAVLHVSLKHSPPWTEPFSSRAANTTVPHHQGSSSCSFVTV